MPNVRLVSWSSNPILRGLGNVERIEFGLLRQVRG